MNAKCALAAMALCLAGCMGATAEKGQPSDKDKPGPAMRDVGEAPKKGQATEATEDVFSRTVSPDFKLVLEKHTRRQQNLFPPEGWNPPPGLVFEPNEVVIEELKLLAVKGAERQVVWGKKAMRIVGAHEGFGPRFVFWDACLIGERVYILYSRDHLARLDVAAKDSSGAWRIALALTIGGQWRMLGKGQILPEADGPAVHYVENGREEIWDLRDDVLVKRGSGP